MLFFILLQKDDSRTGPTLDQIKKATENVQKKNHNREESVAADPVDVGGIGVDIQ